MLETAGGVAGFILEIQFDLRKSRQRKRDQMGIGTALKVGLNDADGFTCPQAMITHVFFPGKRSIFKGSC
ncbi:hypothetical protein D3C76_1216370 [compost metagenome]